MPDLPTTVRDLAAVFADYGLPAERIPRGTPAKLLLRLSRLYARHGLIDVEHPKPLCQLCVNRDPCWESAPDARREGADGDGSLCLPWIGPGYQPGGVAIVGVNPNISYEEQTDLTSEYWISYDQHVRYLAAGYSRTPSRFAYGAYRSAAALLDAAAGRPITDRDPDQLPDSVLQTARLQAVKCVPKRRNSNPTDGMWERCPPMLLASELDILRPGRILVTGAAPRVWGLEMIDGYRVVPCRATDLWRGALARAGYEAQVYGVIHPSHIGNRNERSERALLRHLARTAAAR